MRNASIGRRRCTSPCRTLTMSGGNRANSLKARHGSFVNCGSIDNSNEIRLISGPPRASHFDKGNVRDGAAARWRVVATWARRVAPWSGPRSGPALRLDAARLAQFFLPRLHRPVRIVEAELAVAGLVGDDDDTDMAAALEPAEQNLVGKRLLDVLLDHTRHRAGAHQLVVTVGDQPFGRFVGQL